MVTVLLVAAVLAVFGRAVTLDFVNFDDDMYVTDNAQVQNGLTLAGLRWAFTSGDTSNWYPLTWLSHMLDVELFGLNPAGHHATNVLLHALSAGLLFLVLLRMTGGLWRSALVAGLFALHPLRVESVAWVAERKDVLGTFFWILTMLAYAWYTESRTWVRYLAVACCFALGLMAKPMLVTLPFVLLLLDYWPLNRLAQATSEGRLLQRAGALALEKVPLLAMAAAVSVITFLLQQGGAMNSFETAPVATRLLNATGTYGTYIVQTFWPTGLAAFYPLAPEPVLLRQAILGGALVAAGTLAALVWVRRLPYFAVGWFWYLGTLLPVIGLIQVGAQAHADRYTYIPHIGLLIILVWGLGNAVARWRLPRTVPIAIAGVILPALMLCSWFQVGHWRDSETLWLRSLKVAGSSVKAHYNLGMVYVRGNRIPEAADHFAEAARLGPSLDRAHNNLGNTLATLGRYPEAISEWIVTLRLNPNHPSARQNLNIVITFLMDEGRAEEAETAKALLAELDNPANFPATP